MQSSFGNGFKKSNLANYGLYSCWGRWSNTSNHFLQIVKFSFCDEKRVSNLPCFYFSLLDKIVIYYHVYMAQSLSPLQIPFQLWRSSSKKCHSVGTHCFPFPLAGIFQHKSFDDKIRLIFVTQVGKVCALFHTLHSWEVFYPFERCRIPFKRFVMNSVGRVFYFLLKVRSYVTPAWCGSH